MNKISLYELVKDNRLTLDDRVELAIFTNSDNYVFYGSRSDKNLQIGNAVPTFLSSALKD